MHNGRNVTFAEEQEPEQVADGVALVPLEVPVRHVSSDFLEVNENRRQSIRNYRTGGAQDDVLAYEVTGHVQRLFKIRGISALDLAEIQALVSLDVVIFTNLAINDIELLGGLIARRPGDDADHLVFIKVEEHFALFVHLYARDA
jgi:hypothetical protein